MLSSLHIENIAVIRRADIDFSHGFTALTGETGAGKSIVIDSIGLLLGARGDRELIRRGAASALVSALFCDISEDTKKNLEELGVILEDDGNLSVSRSISSDGRSIARINGAATSLAVLRSITSLLISIHGQNDTRSLADPGVQMLLLDKYAGLSELADEYGTVYSKLCEVRSSMNKLRFDESARLRECEMLRYQIADIDSYKLREGEEDELFDKKLKLRHNERIIKQASFAYRALRGAERGNAEYLLERTAQAVEQLSDVLPECADHSASLREYASKIDEIAEAMYIIIGDNDVDPTEQLNDIESRLEEISKLKRKYGGTERDILAFRDKAVERLQEIENSAVSLARLEKEEKQLVLEAEKLAGRLHTERLKYGVQLSEEICETLAFLDMPKVRFSVSVHVCSADGSFIFNPCGYDVIEFLISANAGIDPAPIRKIASGGELARIMLAIKCVMTRIDGMSTVIFDEIDAGVSGKTARKIGVKLCSVSENTQVLCVTHSAQIASLANEHKLIVKHTDGDTTSTEVITLSDDERVEELARILGGINVTDAQRMAARDMMRPDN